MRTWTRATAQVLCGGRCGQFIERGAPMQLIRLGGVKKLRQRCERCADGEAPPDLPSVEAMKPTFTPMVPMRAVADSLPLDWKAAQSGEREPGSDDE